MRGSRLQRTADEDVEACRRRTTVAAISSLLALLVWTFVTASPSVAAVAGEKLQVQAALIHKFCHFVNWPAGAFSAPNAPIVIGILGEDPLGDVLDSTVKGKVV